MDEVALISGGAGDIGLATAAVLASRGAQVAVSDLKDPADAEPALALLRGTGANVRYDCVDVADSVAVESWVSSVGSDLGPPTIAVANAAVVTVGSLRTMSSAEWTRELRTNLDGAFHVARSAATRMVSEGVAGRIVFVGSWAGHAPHPHVPAYSVAKAGMRMLCRLMALEFAPDGIVVNEIAPGAVDAGLSGRAFEQDPELRERVIRSVPVGRLIEAHEVAEQIAFLADPGNRHVTGATVVMDGGLSLITPAAGVVDADD